MKEVSSADLRANSGKHYEHITVVEPMILKRNNRPDIVLITKDDLNIRITKSFEKGKNSVK